MYNFYFVIFILGKVFGNFLKWKCKDWDWREKWWKLRGYLRGSVRFCLELMNEIGRWVYMYNLIIFILLFLYVLFRCFFLMFWMIWIKFLIWLCMIGVVLWFVVWDGIVSFLVVDFYYCLGWRYCGFYM